jgi:predicted aspartyl protease
MGTFHVGCKIENVVDRSKSATFSKVLVDSGSEYTWLTETILEKLGIVREKKDLAFVMANGQKITRSVGFAIIRVRA